MKAASLLEVPFGVYRREGKVMQAVLFTIITTADYLGRCVDKAGFAGHVGTSSALRECS